jgi:aspartate/methionine/tyrosine aminotransferase
MLRMARVSDIERTNVITTSPSIDIMKFLLEERTSQVKRHFVEAADELVGTLDPDPIIERIALVRRRSARDGLIVLLTSPENPTGAIWSRTALQAISASCCDHDGTLIVDHAFLTAGVHDAKCVPAIWDNAVDGSDWIAIWDTGKTFGLNEDKLGFLVASSSRVSSSIRFALNVVQFDVPRRQKLLFAKILRSPFAWTHAAELRAACRENVSIAEELSWGNALEVLPVAAGSLGLLRLEEHQIDELVRVRLLQAGIGVVSGSVFFHGVRRPTSFLRVALARTPSYFQEAFARLVATL